MIPKKPTFHLVQIMFIKLKHLLVLSLCLAEIHLFINDASDFAESDEFSNTGRIFS